MARLAAFTAEPTLLELRGIFEELDATPGVLVIFIAANLTIGFTFSTIAKNQLQAMQMTFFFFLPSILLSGFMFPFRGMPGWAQTKIGRAHV